MVEIITERKLCVLCEDKVLYPFVEYNNFPIKCVNEENHRDINWNMKLGYCEYCYSVQQMNLLDPTILYGGKYPLDNSHSKIWNEHHDEFSKFIKDNLDATKPLIEIGASSQILLNRLIDRFTDYTIFDFSIETAQKRNGIKYIEGNCENYMFDNKSVLIMSHVFEHLYNPNRFLQNCQENNVNEIIISIPNMDDITSVHITREHTYIYNAHDIVYIYNKYGFTLKSQRTFGFSTFYYFIKDTNIYRIEREIQNERHLYTKEYFSKEFTIPENSYIIGAGFWTQVLIQNIKNKENIAGILDNDKTKQGNYLLGTDYMISPFTKIKDIENPINVIILAKKIWTNEVIDIVHELNNLATIVFLYT